ncbi:Transportin-1 [Zancudomyces culisetae]|uniref:Transportin-1 n=1 Tax=Zancudomyces culisetae TaxID=1213189 RepID=A0A1R1PYK5_ZANCU|nr:Transportin-1 [Zancudomyces culisetae]|eukprot:OMH86037.1 Transportin-1 [Zancudomyces culisetae]
MEWNPQPNDLQQLVELLINTQSTDNVVQQENNNRLAQLEKVPQFTRYLTYVLTRMTEQRPEVRAVAGLLLKNVLVRVGYTQMDNAERTYLKNELLNRQGVGETDSLVRHTLGTVISTVIIKGGLRDWPEGLHHLLEGIQSTDYRIAEGSWDALSKVCEESTDIEEQLGAGYTAVELMVPKFLEYFGAENAVVRNHAIKTVTTIFTRGYDSMAAFKEAYVNELFKRANDDNMEVRRNVCKAIVAVVEQDRSLLLRELDAVIEYMIGCTASDDLGLAMEACEFWMALCEGSDDKDKIYNDKLRNHLPQLVPVLLKGSRYSEDDLAVLDSDDNENDNNVKPQFHKVKNEISVGNDKSNQDIDDDDDDEDEDDEDDEEDEVYSEWNLRKCSAASMDTLSLIYQDELFQILSNELNTYLFSPQWEVRESGILILGAVAEGCEQSIQQHLPQLMPYLLAGICDQKLLEAACSALSTIEESAGEQMANYLQPVLQTLVAAFSTYHQRNLIILYDTIGTLADSVGSALTPHCSIIMPVLMDRLAVVSTNLGLGDDVYDTYPLLECLSSISVALGSAFMPFASQSYSCCVSFIHHALDLAHSDMYADLFDPDLVTVSLDLISSTIQALSPSLAPQLLSSTQLPLFFQLLSSCLSSDNSEIRQSAFALLGDMAINCFSLLPDHLPLFLHLILLNCDPKALHSSINASNNAVWAAGEIIMRLAQFNPPPALSSKLDPLLPTLLQHFIYIINTPDLPLALVENAAVTTGRFAFYAPALVVQNLDSFYQRWISIIPALSDPFEKSSSKTGLLRAIDSCIDDQNTKLHLYNSINPL